MKKGLEIACFNLESALIAETAGALRIELCKDYDSGGLTPNLDIIKTAKEEIQIPIYVMIRPRKGDFYYDETEISQMKSSIKAIKSIGVDGFVFGILDKENELNLSHLSELIELAYPIPCTLHRAFDRTNDLEISLEQSIELGFKAILTSGGKSNVSEGMSVLKEIKALADERIQILPGGGIRSENIEEIDAYLNLTMYHTSAIATQSHIADEGEIRLINKKLNESSI